MVGVAIPVNDSVENDLAAVEQEEEPHNLAMEKQKRNQGTNELTLVTSSSRFSSNSAFSFSNQCNTLVRRKVYTVMQL